MTLWQSLAITAVAIVVFTLAVLVLAIRVYSRPLGASRAQRRRFRDAPPPAARPAARPAGTKAARGGHHAAA